LLAAARRNAQHSTGPRTPAAKQNSKFNALKHGGYAALENHHQTMLALGEDPEEFEKLKAELMTTYGPGDALSENKVEHLARRYWRRRRRQRAQEGLMRRPLQAVEDSQHPRRQEMAGATFGASQPAILDVRVSKSADPRAPVRKAPSYLEVNRAQPMHRTILPQLHPALKTMPGIHIQSESAATEEAQ
jgi:hypothetical protein